MKKVLTVVLTIVGVLVLFVIYALLSYNQKFDVEYPEVQLNSDSATLAHGEYLVYGPAHCASCHVSLEQFEAVDNGEKLPLTGGFTISFALGSFTTSNLTPDTETGIGLRSDKEIARTLRYNVDHEGAAILPFMPFTNMSEYDMNAIISYLRSQPAVKKEVPKTTYTVLGKLIKRFALKPAVHEQEIPAIVEAGETVAYGEYLAHSVANCYGCHTELDEKSGKFVGEPFAGGMRFKSEFVEGRTYYSPNITPDPETGIMADWTMEKFVERMQNGRVHQDSPMPWGPFSRVKESDLKAIYMYISSLEPVNNKVTIVVDES
ncbi:MAG: c-type cytochrome [Bacteroidia bacterium]